MIDKIEETYKFQVIRGATTATGNTFEEIESAVIELIDELILRNNLKSKNLLSITFSVTKDLDACFPASIARKCNGLDSVAFLDCQQMYVQNDINFCIRLMAQVLLPINVPVALHATKIPGGTMVAQAFNNINNDMGMMMDSFDDLEGDGVYYNDGGNGYGGSQ